jgi:hypothetical protein
LHNKEIKKPYMKQLQIVPIFLISFFLCSLAYAQEANVNNDSLKVKSHNGKTKTKDKNTNVIVKEKNGVVKKKDRDTHDKVKEKNGQVKMKANVDTVLWRKKTMMQDSMRMRSRRDTSWKMHRRMRDTTWKYDHRMNDSTGRMHRKLSDSGRRYDKGIMNDSIR